MKQKKSGILEKITWGVVTASIIIVSLIYLALN